MGIEDTNKIIRAYLITQPALIALVSTRIYAARPLPEGCTLPALTFFSRGGAGGNPNIAGIVTPSVQFKCWANDPIVARQVYRALYDSLQGLQDAGSILSATEEVQGQDGQDPDVPELYYVLTFYSFMLRVL